MLRFFKLWVFVWITWFGQAQTVLLKHADSLFVHGNYAQAIAAYNAYENQDAVYEKIAKSYLALGNYDAALKNYGLALQAFPDNALIKYDYAKLLARSKKLAAAALLLNELVYLDYQNPNYHYELGLVLERQGDSTAMNRFHAAFNLDSTHQKAIFKIARHLLAKRQYELSLRYLNTGLESYANNVELINLKALNYYWLADYKEAALWFKKLLELGEDSQFIHEKLSFCHARQKQYNDAILHAQRAISYDPKNATNLYILGQLYEEVEDFAAAEEWIAKALELLDQPLNAEYTKLAGVLNRQQKYKEAIVALQKAVHHKPQDDIAQFALARTKDAYYADLDSVIKGYELFMEKFPKSMYRRYVRERLQELKEQKFMKTE